MPSEGNDLESSMEEDTTRVESPPVDAVLTSAMILQRPPPAPARPQRPESYPTQITPEHLALSWSNVVASSAHEDNPDPHTVPTRTLLPRRKLFGINPYAYEQPGRLEEDRDAVMSLEQQFRPLQLQGGAFAGDERHHRPDHFHTIEQRDFSSHPSSPELLIRPSPTRQGNHSPSSNTSHRGS